jgi:phospholipase C
VFSLTAAVLALIAGVALLSPHRAMATAVGHPSTVTPASPIKHVVYIVQENHSFDNVFGVFCVQSKRCDGVRNGKLYGGQTYPLTDAKDDVIDDGHSTFDQDEAIDGGKMDGYSNIVGCTSSSHYACYSQYLPSQVPNATALAKSFSLSDHTFEDGPVPSWGMHLDAVTTSLDGFTGTIPWPGKQGLLGPGWGCDSGDDVSWLNAAGQQKTVPSCVPDPSLNPVQYPYGGAYEATPVQHVPTIMDEMDTAGLSWRIYAGLGGNDNSNGYGWSICPTFADCIDTSQAQDMVPNTDVLSDAAAGTLPDLSIVTPTQAQSQHNLDSMTKGDNWIGQIVHAVEKGPDWSSTAIFITWDDCGCFYDHVAPPAGSGLGTRVPMIIVSPYAKAGHTDSHVASFASVLAFTEHAFGLPALSQVDADAYDYQDSFDFSQKPLPGVKMVVTKISAAEERHLRADPPNPNDPT